MLLPAAENIRLVDHPFVAVGRVLEERRPMQRVEGAYLHTDPAIHAQAIVDGEAVELVHGLALARLGFLVSLDVDAPARTLLRAEHAYGAVLLEKSDDSARSLGKLDAFIGVLNGDGFGEHRSQRHSHRLEDPEGRQTELATLPLFYIADGRVVVKSVRCFHETRPTIDRQRAPNAPTL
jgi:hypothetical protein